MTPTERLIAATNAATGSEFTPELVDALNSIADLPKAERDAVRSELLRVFPQLTSPSGAGMLAIWFGAGVEKGADPLAGIVPLLDTMLRWSREFVTADGDDGEDPEPDENLAAGMQMLGQGMVAHLSRSPEKIAEIQQREQVIDELARVEHLSVGVTWVLELLRQRSGKLVVLHGTQVIGFRVAYNNISNCFHLFTLVQGALAGKMPGSRTASAQTLAVACGEQELEAHDDAWWHYGQASVPQPDIGGMVFGEAEPSAIESIDGEQVLILWPPIMASRSWDGGFFGPILHACPPGVELLATLSDAEVAHWRKRLKLP